MKTTTPWPLPRRKPAASGRGTTRSFVSQPADTILLTEAQRTAAETAARTAYLKGPRGGSHNWLDAEIACEEALVAHAGLGRNTARLLARTISGSVVRDIETATPLSPF